MPAGADRPISVEIGKRRAEGFLFCALLLLSLAGCGGRKGALREEPPPPPATGPKVAVAPLENRSNDLDASEIIRSSFAGEIARRGWNVLSLAESDRVLRETLGISYGGQLPSPTPGGVCRELGGGGGEGRAGRKSWSMPWGTCCSTR